MGSPETKPGWVAKCLAAFLVYVVRFNVSPLAMAALLDAAKEGERRLAARLSSAELATKHAEDVATTRKSFLR